MEDTNQPIILLFPALFSKQKQFVFNAKIKTILVLAIAFLPEMSLDATCKWQRMI